ncbi:ferric reduction oxidase 2-like [Solanum stenotomum]|uniref:ferric reduction oxidase 2-like n=1 Tax=Solanum stenotomum TaxID=172797 RepID=UPI0020D10D29|nr:ferric reduction oxidase 2-like [Solanum stenotomum]
MGDLQALASQAWGAATLSYLYHSLCRTSICDVFIVNGFISLLQVWAWERIIPFQPMLSPFNNDQPEGQKPLAYKWSRRRVHENDARKNMIFCRDVLDNLRPYQDDMSQNQNDDEVGPSQQYRSILRLLVLLILMGYFMIWIMMPTNTFYLHWLPHLYAKLNSTYFGQQGSNILIYTFPVLFIATLGCIFLHLVKYANVHDERTSKGTRSDSWSRPAITKGPLGIVSWIEFCFLFMFTALLIWSISSYTHGMFKTITRQSAAMMGVKVWKAKLQSVALMLGLVGNICLAFLFFPVTRGSSILRLFGLTSESSVKYHIWLGHAVMALFTAHGLCFIIFWADTHQLSEMLEWNKVGISFVAGEVSLFAGIAMWMTSFPRIRRKLFELFFYTHHLYIIFVVFFVFHVGFTYSCITLPGFYLFLIDRYLRFLQSQQCVCLVSARVLPCQAVELNFSKSPGLRYYPTSSVFINVPSISKLQWHPFTVTSNSNMEPEKLSIVIKSEGKWSQKLFEKLSSTTPGHHLQVSLEGPYGPSSTQFLRHDMLVMVSGGSGITPFISIIRELIYIAGSTGCKIPKVLLVAAFKKSTDLAMLELLLPLSGTNYNMSRLQIQIEAYVTRETEPLKDNQKFLKTLWLKPNASERPVSSVLGQNNWLWLGAIITSSFIMFLLLIAILNRYYIYPIDHNTGMIYSYSERAALSMLLLCVSIAVTASAAFVWNKKQKAKEMVQIQNNDIPTPMTSPGTGSWFNNADIELESLPFQTFTRATQVHYGVRPNLKKKVTECEESNVGVFVSGPRRMKQEIATICSSCVGTNLHFESISFSW